MLRAFGQLLHNISQHAPTMKIKMVNFGKNPTMLQDGVLKCCVRLAGPLERSERRCLLVHRTVKNYSDTYMI